jgi:uncharacterized protein
MADQPRPTPPDERIVSLDVLRGFALLGILLINVRAFGMPEATLSNPTAYGDLSGLNYAVWLGTHVFAEGKFITLFTVMFGAGIVLFTEKKREKDQGAIALHYRRTAILIAIGAAHAYLLWYGDILFAYGVCGLVLVGAGRLEPRRQIGYGLVLLALPSLLEIVAGLTLGAEAFAGSWAPSQAAIQSEITTYRGGWIEQLSHRVPNSFNRQTLGFLSAAFWQISGAMLLGMALYRTGVLTNDRSARFYGRLALGGGLGGLAVVLAGVAYAQPAGFSAAVAPFWRQFNYWGALLLAGGYIGVVMLFCRWRADGPVATALAAVGRTALSNYLLQTVLATTIFYGHGLGLFGRLERIELLGVVVAIWAVQVPLSVLWLRYCRFGPVEWIWRTLTYGTRQPLVRER